ncbi:VanW family protein [Streptomyces sp. NPDC090445]|uniref:VanW family protein n=1 Tax=Streptomyces sp. NPDC090445 TaxID=3365963 RepID=UPI00383015BF
MRRAHRLLNDWRTALPLAGGAVVLGFGGLYLAGLAAAGDSIADGTSVRGVDIGGMSRTEARAALDRGLGQAAAAPITLKVEGGRTAQAVPAAFGLSLDTEATVDRAAQSGSDPFTVIGRLVTPAEKREVEPVVRADGAADRAQAAERLADSAGSPVRDGAVTFQDGTARSVAPATGVTVQADRAAEVVRAVYLSPQAGPAALPVELTQPAVGAQETARAMKEFAEPAMSGPVTLTVGAKRIVLTPEVLGRHLALKADGAGRLVPKLDSAGLLADPDVARQVSAITAPSRGVTFEVDAAGRAVVAEDARSGVQVTAKALGDAVLPLLTRTGDARTAELATTAVPPRLTAQEARRLGIKEKLSSFTVNFPAAPYRTTNIGRAVELINGSVVRPGETWSFNKTVGERTEENGFVDGIMINDGRFVKSPGGGVSAVATTMYNAMFFAGLKPVEHGAHSFYIERYPEGREATVAWGTLDLRWKNDSGSAVYVQAESTDSSVTIRLLGTKAYDEIRAAKGPRTHVTPPKKIEASGPQCEVQTPLEGFDVAVDRIFVRGGQEVKRETSRTHYIPRDEVTCDPQSPAAPTPPAAPAAPAAPAKPAAPAASAAAA